ncbi:MAG: winged helix DNA-binding domain-containing protein [Flavobacterium sp.]|uniref:winged helix DNA-binding domain-containing protein n=1 Tax=Flavobacterium sp. TaxID=239 RepID=UPI003D0E393C
MIHSEISHYRMASQKLYQENQCSPQEIVKHFGAMQAQDYAMAKWAIGSRCSSSEKEIEEAINSAQIIRTHILRPTWHFVSPDDIYWMLELSSPQVKRLFATMAKQHGFDEKKFDQVNAAIEKLLAGNDHLTREEIMQELNIQKKTGDLSPVIVMMNAELDGLVCNGKMKGKQITYTLLEERVSKPKTKLSTEEALAKLALRYFESHGPATVYDFSWWSGFPATICKKTINAIELRLENITIDNQQYWFKQGLRDEENFRESLHFLPAFDEILISYKTRDVSFNTEHQSKVFTNNGIFKPIILENGKVIGIWKRTIKKDHAKIETEFFNETESSKKEILFEGIKAFETYLETKVVIE